jgi:hypothetical protein
MLWRQKETKCSLTKSSKKMFCKWWKQWTYGPTRDHGYDDEWSGQLSDEAGLPYMTVGPCATTCWLMTNYQSALRKHNTFNGLCTANCLNCLLILNQVTENNNNESAENLETTSYEFFHQKSTRDKCKRSLRMHHKQMKHTFDLKHDKMIKRTSPTDVYTPTHANQQDHRPLRYTTIHNTELNNT